MGRISNAICFILALLTLLSGAPALLLISACAFYPRCVAGGLTHFMIGPAGIRPLAIAMVIGPLLILLAYVFALLNCRRQRDVLDRDGRPVG